MSDKKVLVSVTEFKERKQIGSSKAYEMDQRTWKALEDYRKSGIFNNGIYPKIKAVLETHKNDDDFRGVDEPSELNQTQREVIVSRCVQTYGQIPGFGVRLIKGNDNKLRVYERHIL